jgi:plastocyanin
VANAGAWNSGSIAPGGKFSMTFTVAGSFPYHCSIHPGMVGTVTVQ